MTSELGIYVGGIYDDIQDVRVSSFDDDVADALVDTHDTVARAVGSAIAHTLIDDAGVEHFVDDVDRSSFRKLIHDLQNAGYALSDDRVAIMVGAYAYDAARDAIPFKRATNGGAVVDGATGLHIAGFPIRESNAVPDAVAIAVDIGALSKIPPDVVRRRLRTDEPYSVSSPVMVVDPDGVAILNIAESPDAKG